MTNIVAYNEDALILTGTSGTIYLTQDQGENWADISLPVDDYIYSAQFINESKIYVATANNDLWMSDDLGITWNVKHFDFRMSSINFFNDSVGVVSSLDNILQININADAIDTVWSMKDQEFFDSGVIYSMAFSDDSTGFAIGTMFKRINGNVDFYGIIIMSENYGENWHTIFDADSIQFMTFPKLFVNQKRIYASEELNLLYADIDSDEPVWYKTELPYALTNPPSMGMHSITSVFFPSVDTGYVTISPTAWLAPPHGNGYDMILKTCDSGNTWSRQLIDNIDLATTYTNPTMYDIVFINDSVGFACGYNKLFYTTNKGDSVILNVRNSIPNEMCRLFQTGNHLRIDFNQIPGRLDVYIYDISGRIKKRIIEDGTLTNTYDIDLNSFAEGIYIADVVMDGTWRFTKRVVLTK